MSKTKRPSWYPGKHPGGRPKVPPDMRRKAMHIYLLPETHAKIDEIAKAQGLTKRSNVVESIVWQRLHGME